MPVHLLICAITHRSMTKSIKISVLWLLTICGFAAHSIYDVLPMFWGKNMAVVATDGNVDQGMIVFAAPFILRDFFNQTFLCIAPILMRIFLHIALI